MAHTQALQAVLVEEFRARIKQTDESVPVRRKDHVYYSRTEEGRDYPVHARRKVVDPDGEEVLLDVNDLAEGNAYFHAGGLKVSPGQDLLAYAEDNVGRRFYTLRFKDLDTGQRLDDAIPMTTGNLVWANDNHTVFYTKQHPETLRAYQVYRHVLGTDPLEDALVYEEPDEAFRVSLAKSRSEAYLFIHITQTESTEQRFLSADDPGGAFEVFLPREAKHEYEVHQHGDHFYIRSNADGATNFKLMRAPVGTSAKSDWEEVVPHRSDVLLEDVAAFKDHLVLSERRQGLTHLRIRPWSGAGEHELEFGEPTYWVALDENPEYDTPALRYVFSSPKTPKMTVDYDVVSRDKTVLKQDEVLGGFDPANYRTERLSAVARDGSPCPSRSPTGPRRSPLATADRCWSPATAPTASASTRSSARS